MNSLIQNLGRVKYTNIVWLLAVTETIHNIEEFVWLPAWSKSAGVWHPPVGAFEFRFAVVAVTLAFYAVIFYYAKSDAAPARYLMAGTLCVVLFNVFVPHLAATLVSGRYTPGTASGLALNVPVIAYLLWRGRKEGVYPTRTIVLGTLIVAALILPLMAGSFALGRLIESAP